jgi:FKBP-type peptidyl-prolyl cis-trans isomerase
MRMLLIFLVWLSVTQSCSDQNQVKKLPSQKEVNTGLQEVNRQMVLEEDAMILGYIERRGWQMIKSGTGIHYMIYQQGPNGPFAKDGQVAVVDYEVSLMDGTVVYTSKEDGIRSFLIGQDNVESGIHEAITYMKPGDHAKIILPSYRAHGLTGDNDRIPPRSTVIYDIKLLEIR